MLGDVNSLSWIYSFAISALYQQQKPAVGASWHKTAEQDITNFEAICAFDLKSNYIDFL